MSIRAGRPHSRGLCGRKEAGLRGSSAGLVGTTLRTVGRSGLCFPAGWGHAVGGGERRDQGLGKCGAARRGHRWQSRRAWEWARLAAGSLPSPQLHCCACGALTWSCGSWCAGSLRDTRSTELKQRKINFALCHVNKLNCDYW